MYYGKLTEEERRERRRIKNRRRKQNRKEREERERLEKPILDAWWAERRKIAREREQEEMLRNWGNPDGRKDPNETDPKYFGDW